MYGYISNGSSKYVTRVARKAICKKKSFIFDTAVDLNKCLKQIKLPDTFKTSATCSELLSDIRTINNGNGISLSFFDKNTNKRV